MKSILVLITIITKLTLAVPINIVHTSRCFNAQCPPGYHIAVEDTSTECQSSEIHCSPCKDGTFTDAPNTLKKCFPHRHCNFNEKLSQHGTKTTDNICQCINQTYLSASGNCIPWKRCGISERVLIPGNSTHDVVCEECQDDTFSDAQDWSNPCKKLENTQSSVPHNNDIFSTHPSRNISTEDDTAVTTKSTKSEQSDFGTPTRDTLIAVVVVLTIMIFLILGVTIYLVKCRKTSQDSNTNDGKGTARNGFLGNNGRNGRYSPIPNGMQNGQANGETHIKLNTMCNGSQSNVPGICASGGGESGQRPGEDVGCSDVEDDKGPAKGIAETEEAKHGIAESNGDNSPLIAKCTEDPKGNIDDLNDKDANYAVSEIPRSGNVHHEKEKHSLVQDRSDMTGHGNDSDSDEDTVDTKVFLPFTGSS